MKTKESKVHLLSLTLLFLALAVLPFIVRIYAYHLDMEEYSWFILDEDRTDFFSYYKSLFFLILALLMAADLIRALLRRHLSPGTSPVWALLLINGILFLLSAVCSVNVKDSLFGNYGRFESVFVLIGYEILCFYAFRYASDPRTFQILLRGLAAAAALMCLLGFLQAAGMDPLNLEWVQRLITPHELWDEVIGNISSNLTQNTVYLTLANPNYASIYLSMLLPLMFILWKTGSRTVRFCSGCLILLLFADLVLTFSRVGLFSLGIIGILTLILRKNSWKRHWKKMRAAVFACTLLFFLTDSLSGFRFAERLKLTLQSFEKNDSPSLTYMETSAEGVTLTYGGRTITVSYQYGTGNESIRILGDDGTDLTDHYIAPAGILDLEGLENMLLFTREVDEEDMLTLIIDEVFWNFTEDPELGYLFYTGNGKYDTLSEIPRANLFGMEHMASGRLYIWSRTLPLLKD